MEERNRRQVFGPVHIVQRCDDVRKRGTVAAGGDFFPAMTSNATQCRREDRGVFEQFEPAMTFHAATGSSSACGVRSDSLLAVQDRYNIDVKAHQSRHTLRVER